jgi:insulysin
MKNVPIIDELHYPGINEFVPTNFETHRCQVEEKQTKPNLMKETPTLRLWHKKDDTFWIPRTNMWILFRNPLADATPAHSVMTSLYANLLVDSLNVYAYNAEVAGLVYYIDEHTGGLLVSVVLKKMKWGYAISDFKLIII